MKLVDITADLVYSNGKGRFRIVLARGEIRDHRGNAWSGDNTAYVSVALRKKDRFLQVENDRFALHANPEPWRAVCTSQSLASWAKALASETEARNVRAAYAQHLVDRKPYDLHPELVKLKPARKEP